MKSQTSSKLYHACPSTKPTLKDRVKAAAFALGEFVIFILMASFILMVITSVMGR